MKTSYFINEGRTQIVLTPENDFEKNVVNEIKNRETNVQVFKGSFTECQGGWTRLYEDIETVMICFDKECGGKSGWTVN